MRAPKGSSQARNIQARVKISAEEQDSLILLGGKVGLGLRALIDLHMTPITRPTKTRSEPAPEVEYDAVAELAADALAATHRHKRSVIIDTKWDAGMRIEVWACECGKVLNG